MIARDLDAAGDTMAFAAKNACRAIAWPMFLVMLVACGGGGRISAGTAPANRAPGFTSAAAVSVPEGTIGTFYTATASDPDGDAVTFSLSGGVDRAAFRITSAGALSFVAPPDFEAPIDANANNAYLVEITASDGATAATLSLMVTVTDTPSVAYRVRRVVAGYDEPVFLAPVPDGSGRVFVLELKGRILILTPSTGATAALPFLDLTGQISIDGERGLLGFATAPEFTTSGVFYVFATDPQGALEVRRYQTFASNRDRADPTSSQLVLRIPHAQFNNHNGGWIDFGPDGHLYVATGDGGGSGDPNDNAQNTNVLLGKMLRIDVSRDGFPADSLRNYAIPADNPFASGGGAPEIWALGLRNPFRNSFDVATGHLLIGDVGQGAIEEVDLMRPGDGGANFGWAVLEGTRPFKGQPRPDLVPPVTEYSHGTGLQQGNTVIGGYVYRGPVESLRGLYIFADFVRPNIWSLPVSRFVVGSTVPSSEFLVRNGDFTPNAGAFTNIVSFGVDQARNLYIVDLDGEIFVIEARPVATASLGRRTPSLGLAAKTKILRSRNRRYTPYR